MNTVTVNSHLLESAIGRSNYEELRSFGNTPRISQLWFSCPNCFNKHFATEQMYILQLGEDNVLVQSLTTFFEMDKEGQIEGLDREFFKTKDMNLELLCEDCVKEIGISVDDIDIYTFDTGEIH